MNYFEAVEYIREHWDKDKYGGITMYKLIDAMESQDRESEEKLQAYIHSYQQFLELGNKD